MTKEELIDIIADYMIEHEIGFISITASTDEKKQNILCNIHEEFEDDIETYGYQDRGYTD